MHNHKLHMIGNAHLDLVWLWRWQEGLHEGVATMRSVLDRMNECEDFVYTASTAALFAYIEETHPAMFEEIRARVKEGRISLVGGWWVEPDCNAPCGESFARQALYGQGFFRSRFGKMAKVGYCVDSFGHNGNLPQLLKLSGMEHYVMMRPMSHEKGLPSHLFRWEGEDGTQVDCFRILYEYLSWGKELNYHIERCAAEMTDELPEIMCFYGVGNHGGGPTKENLASIKRVQEEKRPYDIIFSSPEKYFASAVPRAKLPVVHGELLHHSAGCYSACTDIKRMNRLAERNLLTAEKLLCADQLLLQHVPVDLDDAWKRLLFNQFHDILAGTSMHAACDDAVRALGSAVTDAQEAANRAIQHIGWNIDIPQESEALPVVVFNPSGAAVRRAVDVELYAAPDEVFTVKDSRGHEIPCQHRAASVLVNGRHTCTFMAQLPAMGYDTFRIYHGGKPHTTSLKAGDAFLENAHYRLVFDPATGCIASLTDKRTGFDVFKGPADKALVIEDTSDTWSHDVVHFNHVVGEFAPVRLKLRECGAVCATMEVSAKYGASTLLRTYTMYADCDRIDVHARLLWTEQQKMLKLTFPVRTFFNRYTWEIPFGTVERGNTGEEYPLQTWMDASGMDADQGSSYGLSLLTPDLTAGSVDGGEIRLTVTRSPVYAHHVPYELDPAAIYDIMEQGVHNFTYSLLPHAGKWEQSDVLAEAEALREPPVVLIETFHNGTLPQQDSLISLQESVVRLTAFKRAENGAGFVVRLYESHRRACKFTLTVCGRKIPLTFRGGEIKTLFIPDDASQSVSEVMLTEEKDV